jgi:hypothetical protein
MSHSPDESTEAAPATPRFGPPTTANPLWRVVVVAVALFCVSCLLWITAGIGNQEAPGNRWLNRNGLVLIGVTGAVSIVSAVGAMVTDSIQTRRMRESESELLDRSSTGRPGDDHH